MLNCICLTDHLCHAIHFFYMLCYAMLLYLDHPTMKPCNTSLFDNQLYMPFLFLTFFQVCTSQFINASPITRSLYEALSTHVDNCCLVLVYFIAFCFVCKLFWNIHHSSGNLNRDNIVHPIVACVYIFNCYISSVCI